MGVGRRTHAHGHQVSLHREEGVEILIVGHPEFPGQSFSCLRRGVDETGQFYVWVVAIGQSMKPSGPATSDYRYFDHGHPALFLGAIL